MWLRRIEDFHNRLSDTRVVWFPFLFLKLKPHEYMGFVHRLKMNLCFSSYFVLGNTIRHLIQGQGFTLDVLISGLFYGLIGFFLWFNMVTAFFWNRRALRLDPSQQNKVA